MTDQEEFIKDEKDKDKEKERDKEKGKDKDKEKEKDKDEKVKPSEIYQAGGHGGVVRVAPGSTLTLCLNSFSGLVKKKTAASEVQFYRDFPSNDRIPSGVKEEFFPRLESVSKSNV